MNRSPDLPWLPRGVRAFGAAALALSVFLAIAPAHAVGRGAMPTNPDQRKDMGERMTPEQRQQWRNPRMHEERQRSTQGFGQPPRDMRGTAQAPAANEAMRPRPLQEQRQDMRNQMTPDERQALRQRFFEQQRNNRLPNDMQRPDTQSPPPRQLSPAERQQLREQILQARERYRNGPNRVPRK